MMVYIYTMHEIVFIIYFYKPFDSSRTKSSGHNSEMHMSMVSGSSSGGPPPAQC